jgi:hypothetical protein
MGNNQSDQLYLGMHSLYSNAEHNIISSLLLIWQFKLFLLPAKGHLGEPDNVFEDLHFNDIIMPILEAEGFAVIVLIVVRIAPTIAVHQIASVADVSIVIKLKLVFLHCSSYHHSQ